MKQCKRCGDDKPLTEFRCGGKEFYCKSCKSEIDRNCKASPRGKAKQAISYSRYKIRQSEEEVEDTLTSYEVGFLLGEGFCMYCQQPLEYAESTIDHIVPLKRGGRNTFDNIACTCSNCNRSKGTLPVILFLLQSCKPSANAKLLERLSLRSGKSMPEVYELLVEDTKDYFASRAEVIPSG
jgi:5-methylcytosine-specific restriction endonuclease McrA